ncbi:hypothetical protein K438DRAFT_1642249, partial [Mycena galopus ATCC 62051]
PNPDAPPNPELAPTPDAPPNPEAVPNPDAPLNPEPAPNPDAPPNPELAPTPDAPPNPEAVPNPDAPLNPEPAPNPDAPPNPELAPTPDAPPNPEAVPNPDTPLNPEPAPNPDAPSNPEPAPVPQIVTTTKEKPRRRGKGEDKKRPGKLSWAHGTKRAFLEPRKADWLREAEAKRAGEFYTMVSKLFVLKYGYRLADNEDLSFDVDDPPDSAADAVVHEVLSDEEVAIRSTYMQTLRTVSTK